MPSPIVGELVFEPWCSDDGVLCSLPHSHPAFPEREEPNAISFYPRQGMTQDTSQGVLQSVAGSVHPT